MDKRHYNIRYPERKQKPNQKPNLTSRKMFNPYDDDDKHYRQRGTSQPSTKGHA